MLYRPVYERQYAFGGLTLIDYLLSQRVAVGIITNGVFLDRLIDAHSSDLSGVAFVRVSLDACNEADYSRAHRTGRRDFLLVLDNIKRLMELRGSGATPAIGVSFLVDGASGLNADRSQVTALARFCADLGIDLVQLKHVHTRHGDAADAAMGRVHAWAGSCAWNRTEVWVHRYTAPTPNSTCVVPTMGQVVGSKAERFLCCHRQDLPLPHTGDTSDLRGVTVNECHSPICRHLSLNRMMLDCLTGAESRVAALERLRDFLHRFGFHPYRLFPSAPELYEPVWGRTVDP